MENNQEAWKAEYISAENRARELEEKVVNLERELAEARAELDIRDKELKLLCSSVKWFSSTVDTLQLKLNHATSTVQEIEEHKGNQD